MVQLLNGTEQQLWTCTRMIIHKYEKNSYLCMIVHYITDNWNLTDQMLYSSLCDNGLKKSGDNIKLSLSKISKQLI